MTPRAVVTGAMGPCRLGSERSDTVPRS